MADFGTTSGGAVGPDFEAGRSTLKALAEKA
jgi:hypothetical protein